MRNGCRTSELRDYMKVCYVDESGTGDEPYAVMIGVLVDVLRMRPTKEGWDDVLAALTKLVGRPIEEVHTRDLYSGKGPWSKVDGKVRAEVVEILLDWLSSRKHTFLYAAVDKQHWYNEFPSDPRYAEVKSLWRFLGLHLALQAQKLGQTQTRNKGNTIFIFDREVKEEDRFTSLVISPPAWTDTYYRRGKKKESLDQLVDVPYFGDSKHVLLLQVADLIAYFVRRYLELANGDRERYVGEAARITSWVSGAMEWAVARSIAYPRKGRCECAELFRSYAPSQLTL